MYQPVIEGFSRSRSQIGIGNMDNVLMAIQPYWNGATWVFDDPHVGLRAEPFVAGVPDMIDRLLERAGLPPP
jgi:hypothetical protein